MEVELEIATALAGLADATKKAIDAHNERLFALEELTTLQATAIHTITGLLTAKV